MINPSKLTYSSKLKGTQFMSCVPLSICVPFMSCVSINYSVLFVL